MSEAKILAPFILVTIFDAARVVPAKAGGTLMESFVPEKNLYCGILVQWREKSDQLAVRLGRQQAPLQQGSEIAMPTGAHERSLVRPGCYVIGNPVGKFSGLGMFHHVITF